MVVKKQYIIIVIGAIIIVGIGLLFFIGPLQSAFAPHISYDTPFGLITIQTLLPESPDNLTLYKVIPQVNDTVFFSADDSEQVHLNVTSEADANAAAQKVLEPFGGLPNDAIMSLDETDYLETRRSNIIPFFPSEVIARDPISTNVQYNRVLNGHQIAGDGGFINIELGNNGELLYLDKTWRTITPTKTVHIISASQAIVKMQRGEILGNRPKCSCELTVTKIVPTYYEKGRNVSQEYLDPVWVFAGTLSGGDTWHYAVYAWQFANFTNTPVSGHTPLSIQFKDTSEASPSRWLWEFGDGMSDTVQNPVYSYKSSGSYNVTLTAWNDLGSDTITRNVIVSDLPIQTPDLNSHSTTKPDNQEISKK
jgi:hypothetical protein